MGAISIPIPTAKKRDNLSVSFIKSAVFFAKACLEIEQKYDNSIALDHPKRIAHKAYGISAIFTTAAFLEATINEIFLDADESIKFMKKAVENEEWVKNDPTELVCYAEKAKSKKCKKDCLYKVMLFDIVTPLSPRVIKSMGQIWNEVRLNGTMDIACVGRMLSSYHAIRRINQ
jgi:hypothetical protein